jgi:hypothetical protein
MAKDQVVPQPLSVKRTGPFRPSRFHQEFIIEQQGLGGYFQPNSLSRNLDISFFVMLPSEKAEKLGSFIAK